jgi:hypothetical protein
LDEIVAAAKALAAPAGPSPGEPPKKEQGEATGVKPDPSPVAAATASPAKQCRHCASKRLHAQHGRYGYFFRCIDCTENTPMDVACPMCGKKGRVRKSGNDFFRECEACKHSDLYHRNVPLGTLFE